MKKLFVILLMLTYGFSSLGMTVQLHYCCGKLKSIAWAPAENKGCGNEHKMGSKPCCDTKVIANKHKADQLLSQSVVKNFKVPVDAALHVSPSEVLTVSNYSPAVTFTSPPLYSSPLFILYRVFRI